DHVHVVFDGGACRLLRRLEQRADVDVEAEIGEGGGDHLGAAVVAVLAHLDHHQARPATKAVAITLAPRSWPSWPILTTIRRGRRPSSSAKAAISVRMRVSPSSPSHSPA